MKLSVTFVQRKYEVLDHLRRVVVPQNEGQAIMLFAPYMRKIIVELKGVETRHTFTRPDGKVITAKVILFPDKSFASIPNVRELFA